MSEAGKTVSRMGFSGAETSMMWRPVPWVGQSERRPVIVAVFVPSLRIQGQTHPGVESSDIDADRLHGV